MASDFEIFNQLFLDSAKVNIDREYERRIVELTEPDHPGSNVKISGVPEDTIVIKLDASFTPAQVLSGKKGECKRCDYIIISNAPKKKVIIFIEIKSTKASRNEIVQQLTGGQCFMTYCGSILKHFWKQGSLMDGYNYRFVCFAHTKVRKQTTRKTRSLLQKSPS